MKGVCGEQRRGGVGGVRPVMGCEEAALSDLFRQCMMYLMIAGEKNRTKPGCPAWILVWWPLVKEWPMHRRRGRRSCLQLYTTVPRWLLLLDAPGIRFVFLA